MDAREEGVAEGAGGEGAEAVGEGVFGRVESVHDELFEQGSGEVVWMVDGWGAGVGICCFSCLCGWTLAGMSVVPGE